MAHTDKTRPTWVQMLDATNKGWKEEHHNHTKGICDIAESDPKFPWKWCSHCTMWPSKKAMHEGIFPRPTRRVRYYTYGYTRGERTAWREIRNRVIQGDLDAADESPLTYHHRHRALWDAY